MAKFDFKRFSDSLAQLSDLPRTGWLFCGVQNPESIAAHSFGVVAISVWMAEVLGVDGGEVARIAVLHDLAEAVVTDIPGPVKTQLGASIRVAEQRIGVELADAAMEGWGDNVRAYAASETRAAKIVKVADFIQMILQARRYDRFGNGDVSSFLTLEIPKTGDPEIDALVCSMLAD